jgi:hypothetical protein
MKLKIIAAATLSLAAMGANAALTSAGTPICALTDVSPGASACSGSWVGNDKNQQADVFAALNVMSAGTWINAGASDDAGNGPFTSNSASNTGTLTFDSPVSGTFAVAVKAANNFSLYVWNNVSNVALFDFSTAGVSVNTGGVPNGLSHASLYVKEGQVTVVPEPSTYALVLAGLGMMGLVARRRARK